MTQTAVKPITNKTQMYAALAAGEFGNTIGQYFSVEEWEQSDDSRRYQQWGVRSLTVGGPCRLFCPSAEVARTAKDFNCPFNISCMVDVVATVTLWADVYDSASGLTVCGIEYPEKGGSWRKLMPVYAREWRGTAARMMLRKNLNPNSYDDLEEVFRRYPGHVIELSALDICMGVVPHRNAVIWECRGGNTGEFIGGY